MGDQQLVEGLSASCQVLEIQLEVAEGLRARLQDVEAGAPWGAALGVSYLLLDAGPDQWEASSWRCLAAWSMEQVLLQARGHGEGVTCTACAGGEVDAEALQAALSDVEGDVKDISELYNTYAQPNQV